MSFNTNVPIWFSRVADRHDEAFSCGFIGLAIPSEPFPWRLFRLAKGKGNIPPLWIQMKFHLDSAFFFWRCWNIFILFGHSVSFESEYKTLLVDCWMLAISWTYNLICYFRTTAWLNNLSVVSRSCRWPCTCFFSCVHIFLCTLGHPCGARVCS